MAFNDLTVQLALADTEEEGAQSLDLFKYICFCLTIFAGKKILILTNMNQFELFPHQSKTSSEIELSLPSKVQLNF